jgi:hypothetical protein
LSRGISSSHRRGQSPDGRLEAARVGAKAPTLVPRVPGQSLREALQGRPLQHLQQLQRFQQQELGQQQQRQRGQQLQQQSDACCIPRSGQRPGGGRREPWTTMCPTWTSPRNKEARSRWRTAQPLSLLPSPPKG